MEEIEGTLEAPVASEESQLPVADAPAEETPDLKTSLFALLKERPDYEEEYLDSLSDEETSRSKAFNRRVDKGITKARRDLEQKYSKETEERTQSQQWMQNYRAWASNATPDELLNASVQYASEIARHTAILAKAAPANDAQAIVVRAEQGFKNRLKAKLPEVEDWDDVTDVDGVDSRIETAKEKIRMKAIEENNKSWEERFKALKAQMKAVQNLNADQPDRISNDGRANGEAKVTRQQIADMPDDEYQKFRSQLAGARR
jgi:hypothetical protein